MALPRTFDEYQLAREQFGAIGVDTESALAALSKVSISLPCWQGDDVRGFERSGTALGGGLAVTGNCPGRARNPDELRMDAELAFSLLPGRHRFNLHAIYGEFGRNHVDRDAIEADHFSAWTQWAAAQKVALDFNPTCFAHPRATDGFTLAHHDPAVREFWIEHCRRARRIAAAFGKTQQTPAMCNVWVPDGFKDTPADRQTPRERLAESLDEIFAERFPETQMRDAVEPKLFGIGSESYVVGSHEFYVGYAITRQKVFCLDAGHFHPTESVGDKISALLLYVPGLLLHLSRGVRWDSDHVVTFTDELREIAHEVTRPKTCDRVSIGMDYFDATINRVAAWVIGTRSVQRALLAALLQPHSALVEAELSGDYTKRLALQEEAKFAPVRAVWREFCARHDVPAGAEWLEAIRKYEKEVLSERKEDAR